jgi:hypothetical protein
MKVFSLLLDSVQKGDFQSSMEVAFILLKIFDEIREFRVICGFLKQLRGLISSQDFVSKKGEGLTSCLG